MRRSLTILMSALAAAASFSALAGAAAASQPVKRYRVVAGWVHQTVFWYSHSSSDDGCYTINHNDNGSLSIDLTAKEGRMVTMGYDDEPRGFVFEGSLRKSSTFHIGLVPKKNEPPDCPSPDDSRYQPPSTSGCKGGARQRASEAGNYLYLREEFAGPRLSLFGVFDQPSNCPSEDSYAVSPIPAPSDVTVKELRHARGRITIDGHKHIEGVTRGVSWLGYMNRGGHTDGSIDWHITLEPVG